MDFTGFKTILPNSVYAIHDYSTMGFPAGVPYEGTGEQKEILQRQYERKVQFMKEHGVPVYMPREDSEMMKMLMMVNARCGTGSSGLYTHPRMKLATEISMRSGTTSWANSYPSTGRTT
jgi:hypothetical protein